MVELYREKVQWKNQESEENTYLNDRTITTRMPPIFDFRCVYGVPVYYKDLKDKKIIQMLQY